MLVTPKVHDKLLPAGSAVSLMMYDTVSSALTLLATMTNRIFSYRTDITCYYQWESTCMLKDVLSLPQTHFIVCGNIKISLNCSKYSSEI